MSAQRGISAVPMVIGLAVIAVLIGGIFYMQRGDTIDLPGKIIKVRTALLDDGKCDGPRCQDHSPTSVAVVDFKISNPSDIIFEVRTVTVEVTTADGKKLEGKITSDIDAAAMMKALPVDSKRIEQWPTGEKYNKTLTVKERIGAHKSEDRMAAAYFELPIDQLDARKNLTVRIEEVDGKIFAYSEHEPPAGTRK
jgi:hypothetical protein